MSTSLIEARQHANDLIMKSADMKIMQQKMDEMILMDWVNEKPTREDLKFTVSPEARNAWLGALRILSSTEPIITVPRNANDLSLNEVADQIEKICKAIWYQSGRVAQRPVHYDLLNSLLRYDEYHLAIKDTQDMLDLSKKNKSSSPAEKHRLEKLAASTPYVFEAMDVKSGYWERDSFGLTCYYRKTAMTYGQAVNLFGQHALDKSNIPASTHHSDQVYHHDYWDLSVHYAWLSRYGDVSENDYLLVGSENNGRHELPYIPIVCQTAEASPLEGDSKYRRQPLLYGAWKGSLWERMNLIGTIIYSSLFAVASNPMYVHTQAVPGSKISIDHSVIGGITDVPPGESLQLLQRDVINKDLEKGMLLAEQKFSESTIYKQVLGGDAGSNASFSQLSLMSQQGRLPLINYQRCGGWGIGTAFEIMFDLMKDRGQKRTVQYLQGKLDIDPKELPEDLLIEVNLDADLPQDKLQQANIGSMLKQNGLASTAWIRENILNIGQSEDMTRQVQEENFIDFMFREGLTNQMRQEIAAEEKQKAQEQAQLQAQQAVQQIAEVMKQQAAQGQGQRQPLPGPLQAQNLAQRPPVRPNPMQPQGVQQQGQPLMQRRPQMPIDQSRNAAMGGMPPSARGLIPAQAPGQTAVPAEDYTGEMQEGEETLS